MRSVFFLESLGQTQGSLSPRCPETAPSHLWAAWVVRRWRGSSPNARRDTYVSGYGVGREARAPKRLPVTRVLALRPLCSSCTHAKRGGWVRLVLTAAWNTDTLPGISEPALHAAVARPKDVAHLCSKSRYRELNDK